MASRSKEILRLALLKKNLEDENGEVESIPNNEMDDEQLLNACEQVIEKNTEINLTLVDTIDEKLLNSCEQLIQNNLDRNQNYLLDTGFLFNDADELQKSVEIFDFIQSNRTDYVEICQVVENNTADHVEICQVIENNVEICQVVENNTADHVEICQVIENNTTEDHNDIDVASNSSNYSDYVLSESDSTESDEVDLEQEIDPITEPPSVPVESKVPLTQPEKELMMSLKKAVTNSYRKSASERVLGKSYIGYSRSKKLDNNKVHRVGKTERILSSTRCPHTSVQKKSDRSFMCGLFSEEDREKVFGNFWKIPSWDEKKGFVRGSVVSRPIKRRRNTTKKIDIKKTEGHDIFLRNRKGENIRVCRKFFLNTLNLGEDMFRTWVKDDQLQNESVSAESGEDEPSTPPPTPAPPTPAPGRSTPESRSVKQWLDLIPKVPSHYCRATNKKTFVECTFTSFRHMHQIYSEWCQENNEKSTGRKTFNKVLQSQNIAIHKPRKDQCDTCISHSFGHISDEEFTRHRDKKNRARAKKKIFEDNHAKGDTLVLSMDLQSVLLCPKLSASCAYYKQKLQLHNFTIYEKNTGHVELYVWHESNGGVSSNEFVSCLAHYITSRHTQFKTMILISDGCNYQNRNKVLASTLSSLSAKFNITIRQLILEKGHTMMPCDSVHSATEHFFTAPIFAPSEYIARIRLVRPQQPYNVNVIDFTFFKNYESRCNVSSIRPGKKVGDPVVCDIRQLLYTPNGSIQYDLDYGDDFQQIPIRRQAAANIDNVPQLYRAPIPIDKKKFDHLQEMKNVIPADHHEFYDSLPHN